MTFNWGFQSFKSSCYVLVAFNIVMDLQSLQRRRTKSSGANSHQEAKCFCFFVVHVLLEMQGILICHLSVNEGRSCSYHIQKKSTRESPCAKLCLMPWSQLRQLSFGLPSSPQIVPPWLQRFAKITYTAESGTERVHQVEQATRTSRFGNAGGGKQRARHICNQEVVVPSVRPERYKATRSVSAPLTDR